MVRRLSVEVTTGQNFSLHTGDPSGLGSLFTEEFFFFTLGLLEWTQVSMYVDLALQ